VRVSSFAANLSCIESEDSLPENACLFLPFKGRIATGQMGQLIKDPADRLR